MSSLISSIVSLLRCSSFRLVSRIGLSPSPLVTLDLPQSPRDAVFRAEAESLLASTTVEIDVNGDGFGEVPINLSSTNTLWA